LIRLLCVQVAEPTPRPNRISHDYSRQFTQTPSENRQAVSATVVDVVSENGVSSKIAGSRNVDNVKLNEEVCRQLTYFLCLSQVISQIYIVLTAFCICKLSRLFP
jgi:hypothetical protein